MDIDFLEIAQDVLILWLIIDVALLTRRVRALEEERDSARWKENFHKLLERIK